MTRLIPVSLLLALLGIVCLAALGSGAMPIGWHEIGTIIVARWGWIPGFAPDPSVSAVIFDIRLPRVLLGILVGAVLGLTGAVMQVLFRNPLADSGLTGVSAGAALGAAAVILLAPHVPHSAAFFGAFFLPLGAFAGGLVTAGVVFVLSRGDGRTPLSTLLLAGVALNALCGALMGWIIYAASETQLRTLTFWTLGSLGGASWEMLRAASPFMIVGLLVLPFFGKSLNAMTLGDQEAFALGVPVERVKVIAILLTTLGVGAAVAVSGMIGFVGIVIPHLLRLLFGSDHRWLLIAAALAGAALLVGADTFARIVVAPAELPIGILTALIGAPFLLALLMRFKARGGGV